MKCEYQFKQGNKDYYLHQPCRINDFNVADRTTHGKYTKEKRAAAKRFAEQGRQMRAELAELEAWFVDHGHLDKNWRKDWEL